MLQLLSTALVGAFTPRCQAASCDGTMEGKASHHRVGSHHTAKDTARSTLGAFYVVRLYICLLTLICSWHLPSCHTKESSCPSGTALCLPKGLLHPHAVCRARCIARDAAHCHSQQGLTKICGKLGTATRHPWCQMVWQMEHQMSFPCNRALTPLSFCISQISAGAPFLS